MDSDDIRMSDKDLLELYAGGRWFQFPRHLMLIMSCQEAVLISFLINHAAGINKKAFKKNDGWFYCKKRTILMRLFLPLRMQTRIVKRLMNRGYLESKWKGLPAKRFFKIFPRKLHEDSIQAAVIFGEKHRKLKKDEITKE